MTRKKGYVVAGLMSGSSCDGLDIALCRLYRYSNRWQYKIIRAETRSYDRSWIEKLNGASLLDAQGFLRLHGEYGRYLGRSVKSFLGTENNIDLVASHGHTVFHRPESRLTFQLGDGAGIASFSGITTVSDFRRLDVEHGGQGAPLVPVGDELLFSEYDACLNLGGFANISYKKNGIRVAFDICPVNTVLNRLAAETGHDFDEDGRLGRSGRSDEAMVRRLNDLPYYRVNGPKSLGREWLESTFLPVILSCGLTWGDKLRSVYEHVAQQINSVLHEIGPSPLVLLTGGGTFNTFLVDLLRQSGVRLVIPDPILVKYKEALVFALLGLLRYRCEVNCLASVTGAERDLVTGVIHAV